MLFNFNLYKTKDLFRCIMSFYAVHVGHKPGVYKSWLECESQVKKFRGAKYKKFSNFAEAEHFVKNGTDFKTENMLLCQLFADELDSSNTCDNTVKGTCTVERSAKNINFSQKRKLGSIESNISEEASSNKQESSASKKLKPESCQRPVVYTDGACSKNGQSGSTAGFGVWWGKDHPLNLSRKLKGIQTNQRAEIAAVNAAIGQAKEVGYDSILIKTDSKFIINCITGWVHGWKKNNWVKADGKAVVHKKEFKKMLELMKDVNVEFEHVRGHKGIYGNEMADRLAVAGARIS